MTEAGAAQATGPDPVPTGAHPTQDAGFSWFKRNHNSSAIASPTFWSAPELGQGCWERVPDEALVPHGQQA